jgi:hypothetical protein
MSVLLDAASKSAHAVITGGLVLSSDSTLTATARADTIKSAGKFMFEARRLILSFSTVNVGLTSLATPSPTSAVGAVIIDKDGFVYVNGVFLTTFSPAAEPILFAVDLGLGKLWLRAGSGWSGGGDPCAGTGGYDISSVSATGLYPYAVVSERGFGTPDSSTVTFNFGATSFVNTLPACSGWDGWEPSTPPTPPLGFRQNARLRGFRNGFTTLAALPPLSVRMAVTEQRDVFAGTVGVGLGVTMAVTEQRDVFAAVIQHAPPPALEDGDFMYVPAEPGMFVQPDRTHSRFVIPSEGTMYVTR